MNKNERFRAVKKVLIVCILFILLLPMIQQRMKFISLSPLCGSYTKSVNPHITSHKWFEGEYQTEQQNYVNQNNGFNSFFVRLYNQEHFSLYRQAKANGVIIGKNDYLYEENYIKAYLGIDFVGDEKIRNKTEKLKNLNAILKLKGIRLLVVLAPGKGSFYPEFIPDHYNPQNRTITNYEVYKREILKTDVHLLDFHAWFRKMKNTSSYPLFPKTGLHWSKYGELLAADSLIRYINSIQEKKKVPELAWGEIETSLEMQDTDDDIEKGMNLLFNIEDLPMGYPQFAVQKNTDSVYAKALTVADSYYWGMFNWGCSREVFNEGQFWYYNKQIYPESFTKPLNVDDINKVAEVEKNDIVILMCTDANLTKFAFGFIDQLYDAYLNLKQVPADTEYGREIRIQLYIHTIKESPEWFEMIKSKAKEENIPLEQEIRKNAEFMVWSEEMKNSATESEK